MTRYYRLIDGNPEPLDLPIMVDGRAVLHPTEQQATRFNAYPLANNPPPSAPSGKHYEATSYEIADGEIRSLYALTDDPAPAVSEYDAAMEEHFVRERSARGYTTREPDAYRDSSVPRWAQDARDWVAYRDRVMEYAIGFLNAVESGTVELPTLEEFRASLPHIVWTYKGDR